MRWFASDRDGNLAFFDSLKDGAVPNPVIDSWRVLFEYCREVAPHVKQLFLSEPAAHALVAQCNEEALQEMLNNGFGSYILLLDERKKLNFNKLLQRSNKKAFAVQLSEIPPLLLISDVYDYVTATPPKVKDNDDDDDDYDDDYDEPAVNYSTESIESVDGSNERMAEMPYFYFDFSNRYNIISDKPVRTTLNITISALKVIKCSLIKLYEYYFPPRIVNKYIAKGIKNKTIIGACKFDLSAENIDLLGAFRYVYDTETDYMQYYKEIEKLRYGRYDDPTKIEYDFCDALKPYLRKAEPEAPLNVSQLDASQTWKIPRFDSVLFSDYPVFQPKEFFHKPISDEKFEKYKAWYKPPDEMILSNGILVDYHLVTPYTEFCEPWGMRNYVINFKSISYQEFPMVFIAIESYNQKLSAYENYRPEDGFLLDCLNTIFNIKQIDCYYTALIKGARDRIDEIKETLERQRKEDEAEQPEGGVKYVSMNMSEITKPLIEQMNEEDLAKYYRKHEREIEAEEQARNHAGKNRFLHGGWLYWFENELEQKRPALVIVLGDEAKATADVYSVNYYKTEARETILQEIQTKQSNDWIPFKTLYLDDKTLANKDLLQQKLLEAKLEIDTVLSEPRPWREIKIIPKTPERRINYADIEGDTGKVLYIERKSKTPKKTYVKPEPEPNDLGLYHIAGFQHYQGDEVAEQLKVGTELTLKAEPENEYDPNAVAIYFGDKKLGYIPKGKNEELSKLLRYGREGLFEVKINYKDLERHPERQFGIAVKIKTHVTSKDPFSPLFTEIQ